jgi:hypothetical protein
MQKNSKLKVNLDTLWIRYHRRTARWNGLCLTYSQGWQRCKDALAVGMGLTSGDLSPPLDCSAGRGNQRPNAGPQPSYQCVRTSSLPPSFSLATPTNIPSRKSQSATTTPTQSGSSPSSRASSSRSEQTLSGKKKSEQRSQSEKLAQQLRFM